MRCSGLLFGLLILAAGCPFNPEPPAGLDDDGATSTGDDPTTPTLSGSDTTPSTGPSTTNPTEPTTGPTGGTDTDDAATCGDGEQTGDEACDDGVNDGSYGGCMPDCAALAPYCGDGETQAPEVCDDGVNDGGYGGCQSDCSALGPYCGDGEAQAPEACDDGDANEDAAGCNTNCVVSGSVVAEYTESGVEYCDGAFVTPPVFRDNGNVLASSSGYCEADSLLLYEFDTSAEIVREFDDLVFPQTPLRGAAMLGQAWALGTEGCNYVISAAGGLAAEVCENPRVTGAQSLHPLADGYIAVDFNTFAYFGPASPAAGDSPIWQRAAGADGATFYSATTAPGNTVLGVGTLVNGGNAIAYISRFTAANNEVNSSFTAEVTRFDKVASGPDGEAAAFALGATRQLYFYDDALDAQWQAPLPDGDLHAAFDAQGDLLLLVINDTQIVLRKFDTSGGLTQKWSQVLGEGKADADVDARVAVDESDRIWVSSARFSFEGTSEFSLLGIAP